MERQSLCDIAFIRMDRIGDLILTLPVDQQETLKHLKSQWFISTGLEFILENSQPKREFTTLEKEFSLKNLYVFYKKLRKIRPKTAIVFHAPWWVGLALFLARVPNRVGRFSQWHSFLFFNLGIRQKRSLAEMHEFDYNLELANKALGQRLDSKALLEICPQNPEATLKKHNLTSGEYFVVHPGMNGSALNWSTRHYIDLVHQLEKLGHEVVITGTASDEPYLAPLKKSLNSQHKVYWLDQKLNGSELIDVLSQARGCIAPSTGVVHIAASTGIPTVGIYSNVRVESARRWGPKGKKAACVAPKSPLAKEAPPEVMNEIKTEEVLKSLEKLGAL